MVKNHGVICFTGLLLLAGTAGAETDRVIVTGEAYSEQAAPMPHTTGGSTGAFIQWVPGGGLNMNGQLSGLLQYRGMFGPRVGVLVDDVPVAPAGPIWMDPPLHYAPKTLLKSVQIHRGIAPVSSGSGLGGHAYAEMLSSEFSEQQDFVMHGSAEFLGHSADNGYNSGVFMSLSNNRHRFHLFGSRDDGDDISSGDSDIDIDSTEYKRGAYGIGYGFLHNGNEFAFDYKRVHTGDTGVPSLPMDIDYYHAEFGKFAYNAQWGETEIAMKLHHNDIEHEMSNYHLRAAPDFDNLSEPPPGAQKPGPFHGTDERRALATSDGIGFSLDAGQPFFGGQLKVGVNGYSTDHDMTLSDPGALDFYVDNFNNVEVDRLGFFVEWGVPLNERWSVSAGARYENVETSADEVDAFPADLADGGSMARVPQGAQILRDTFNASDLRQNDDNVDAVLQFSYAYNDDLDFLFGVARKTRSPDYVERYVWIPLETNAGLGDGNNYVGDPDLEPEFSHEVELGADWQHGKWYVAPRIYHRWVNNYIQGVAVDCANAPDDPNDPDYGYEAAVCDVSDLANGDPSPKQFANVDANIYGADVEFAYRVNADWTMNGIASYTRGRRDDISDNLFRISPHKILLAFHRGFDWGGVTFETLAVDEQDKLADSLLDEDNFNGNIDNEPTPGYVLFNLRSQYRWQGNDNLVVSAGIENFLDKYYRDHLATFNRVTDSDVAVGERLPGAGRSFFFNLKYTW